MARFAVIDIGTNSIKFHIGERKDDGTWGVVLDRADLTRLGETLQSTGEIGPETMERNVAAIAGMVAEAAKEGAGAVAAVGTMALRTARNSKQFIDRVRERCGLAIEVIPGEEESRLSYLAVKSGVGLSDGSMVIFDTGGGSTEFVFGKGTAVQDRFSLNVGALRFTESFGLGDVVTPERLKEAMDAVGKDLERLDAAAAPDALVGMGGTVTNIAGVRHRLAKYDPDIVQGSTIDKWEIDRQIELYRSRSVEDRRHVIGLQPKRADVILAGLCIVHTIMEKLHKDIFTVSDRGLRHGLLVDRFGA
ncbi:MAG: Ppx/GppA family phosphatase [Ignavibacteriae bacterium]|nr:Ppx/GppA family phosphatase [Ignavibacteriota bacterium]